MNFDQQLYADFSAWCRSCPFVSGSEAAVVVSDNPMEIHWLEDRLHNESGPAVEWGDGWSLWSIDGISVDKQIVMQPETQSVEQIDSEHNADIRSIRIERFGWARYLKESGAEVVDERKNDIDGTTEALYQTARGERRLVAVCPTARVFAMGVPSQVKTCEAAQNWLAGEKPFRVLART